MAKEIFKGSKSVRDVNQTLIVLIPKIDEKWGLFDGLIMAWDKRFRRVIVECDSLVLVQLINNNRIGSLLTGLLWLRILELMDRRWEAEVVHTMREGNRSADWLANYRVSQHIGLETLDTPLVELVGIL
ncbi:hypothetical protein L6164_023660 [Bauhinia variegata]|uniref:Uncharacterized protein n=1 Tax=Bauhinia variegata TaxID=167791 RepID=A0ACB9MJB2_BAUVA|nr:hypothetical protein L6164_023660 [Bauhinia variegata]